VKGVELGSNELWFIPSEISGGTLKAKIGTAGSIPMLLLTVLPICAHARKKTDLLVSKGGTDVRNAPTINYLYHVLLPTLAKMGLVTSLNIQAFGYYPVGMGAVSLEVQPCPGFTALQLEDFGNLAQIYGVSVCTFLQERKVAERQAKAAQAHLKAHGYDAEVEVIYDTSNPHQRGSSLTLWATTHTGVLLGADAIGELRKPSEVVGGEAAGLLLKELEVRSTVDTHLADMLVPYIGLAKGSSSFLTRSLTEHLDTNIWLTKEILGVELTVQKVHGLYLVKKM
jgi:RNA 3'-terminal phosphate cyclase (ATP)